MFAKKIVSLRGVSEVTSDNKHVNVQSGAAKLHSCECWNGPLLFWPESGNQTTHWLVSGWKVVRSLVMFGQNGADHRVFLSCSDPAFKPGEQTFAPQSSQSLSKPPEYTSPVCKSAPKWFLTEPLKGGRMRSGVSAASGALWDRLGDLTGLMIFLEVTEDEDNSFCKVAIAVPAMET